MGHVAAPPLRPGLLHPAAVFAVAMLSGGPALADRPLRNNAVVETFTCANLSPGNAASPEAMQQIGRAIAMVYNTGSLPPGSGRARVVLRLCFNESLDQPVIELVDYTGPAGAVADATEEVARRSLRRALASGTLTRPLAALTEGRPETAVIDLVFGTTETADEGETGQ